MMPYPEVCIGGSDGVDRCVDGSIILDGSPVWGVDEHWVGVHGSGDRDSHCGQGCANPVVCGTDR